MKKNSLIVLMAALVAIAGCNKVSYKKTPGGLTYNIFPGDGKDSLIRDGDVVKFNVLTKLGDSVLGTSYDKAPVFWKYVKTTEREYYNVMDILSQMKAGDSAITIQMVDTLINRGAQVPPGAKKGDRITTYLRILNVFSNDSIARIDYDKEVEKDMPRRLAEQAKQMAEQNKQREEAYRKDDERLEKSGEIARELKEMEAYLKAKGVKTQKSGKGTYVYISEQGTGPQAENGKYLKVKYSGRLVENDSLFDSGTYPLQLGTGGAIRGWDEGLLLFKQGGKGTMYIPGFLAYSDYPSSRFKPFAAMKFDVEVLEVSDKPISQ